MDIIFFAITQAKKMKALLGELGEQQPDGKATHTHTHTLILHPPYHVLYLRTFARTLSPNSIMPFHTYPIYATGGSVEGGGVEGVGGSGVVSGEGSVEKNDWDAGEAAQEDFVAKLPILERLRHKAGVRYSEAMVALKVQGPTAA